MPRSISRFSRPRLIRASVLNRDENGHFYNAPSLGSELFVNGSFAADANWTKGAGWTIAGGVAVGTATSAALTQNVGTMNRYVRLIYDLASRTSGSANSQSPPAALQSVPATYTAEGLINLAASGIIGSTFTGTVDNASLKQFTHSECFVLAQGFHNYHNLVMTMPSAPNNSRLSGITLCDSLTNPLSYLSLVYTIDTAGAALLGLTKYVNDARTALIAATAITFVANAPCELRRLPSTNTFQVWYNGVQVGTDQTVSDAAIINNNLYGFVGLSNLALVTDLKLDGMSIF